MEGKCVPFHFSSMKLNSSWYKGAIIFYREGGGVCDGPLPIFSGLPLCIRKKVLSPICLQEKNLPPLWPSHKQTALLLVKMIPPLKNNLWYFYASHEILLILFSVSLQEACVFPPNQPDHYEDPFKIDKTIAAQRRLTAYTGTYFNVLFHNVTISLLSESMLQMVHGDIDFYLYPNDQKDSFTAVIKDLGWYMGPAQIDFIFESFVDQTDIKASGVRMEFMEPSDPPVFKRLSEGTDSKTWLHLERQSCRKIKTPQLTPELYNTLEDSSANSFECHTLVLYVLLVCHLVFIFL